MAHLRTGPHRDGQRQHAEDEGEGGHQDRTEPHPGRLDGSLGARLALRLALAGEFHDQDGVLCRQPDQHDESHLGQDVDVHAAEEQAADRGQQAHGHDQDHRQRQRPALILRRQHEEDEDHRSGEDEEAGAARQLLLIGELGPFEAESVGQGLGRQLLHGGQRLARRMAGCGRTLHLARGVEVVARQAIGAEPVLEGGDGSQRHHLALGIAGLVIGDLGELLAEGAVGLDQHLIGAAQIVELVDIGGAEIDLEGLEDLIRRHPQHLGPYPVDIGIDIGRVGIEHREDAGELGLLVAGGDHVLDRAVEGRESASSPVLHHHLEPAGIADAAHRGRGDGDHEGALDRAQPSLKIGDDLGRREAFGGALGERLQHREDGAGVRRIGERRAIEASEGDHMGHALGAEYDLGGLPDDRIGAGEGGAGRQLDDGDHIALILRRDESGGRAAELPGGEGDQPGIDEKHHRREADEAAGQRAIAMGDLVEAPVEAPEEAVQQAQRQDLARLLGQMGFEEDRAEGRAQGEGHEKGDAGRRGDGDRELAEELAGDAGDEGRGDEDGGQHQGDRHQRAADLVHGLVGGLARRHPRAQIPLDILHHHDGVVDHDADGEHEAEEREIVEGEAQGLQEGEGADQGDRDGDNRDDRSAPGLQEQQHDDDHKARRLVDRLEHLIHRFGDELRRIVDDPVFHPRGEGFRQLGHGRFEAMGCVERIGAGLLEDSQRHGGAAVEIAVDAIVLGRELDPRDVAQPRHPPVGIGIDDDIGELPRLDEAAQGLDIQLEVALIGHGRLVQHARSDLDVLGPDRRDHVAGREAPGGDLGRVDPDAHGIVAGPEDDHIADAFEPRQHILDLQGRVIRHVELVARAVG